MEELARKYKHRLPGQHICHGMLQNKYMLKAVVDRLPTFEIYSSDVIVTGYPKTGTTWLEEIVYLIVKEADVNSCNQMPNYMRVPLLEDERSMPLVENQAHPRIFKTHLPFHLLPAQTHEKQAKIVHIMRNPKDTAVSMYHFYRSVAELGSFKGSWAEFLEMFADSYVINGSWFEHVLGWWRERHRSNMLIIKYEDLVQDQSGHIVKIADFLDKKLDQESLATIANFTTFQNMKANPMTNFSTAHNLDEAISPFMRKGKVGDWKTHFTVSQNDHFDDLYSRHLSGTDLEFNFD